MRPAKRPTCLQRPPTCRPSHAPARAPGPHSVKRHGRDALEVPLEVMQYITTVQGARWLADVVTDRESKPPSQHLNQVCACVVWVCARVCARVNSSARRTGIPWKPLLTVHARGVCVCCLHPRQPAGSLRLNLAACTVAFNVHPPHLAPRPNTSGAPPQGTGVCLQGADEDRHWPAADCQPRGKGRHPGAGQWEGGAVVIVSGGARALQQLHGECSLQGLLVACPARG